MSERLEALIEELRSRPIMLAQEFASALREALQAGESVTAPIPGHRLEHNFLHELVETAPNRADLLLEATAPTVAGDLSGVDLYGNNIADKLTFKGGYETLRELIDADRPIAIDPPTNRISGQPSAYRMALAYGPMSLVTAMHEFSARMADRGQEAGKIHYRRAELSGKTVLHDLIRRRDLSPGDVADYANDLQFVTGASPQEIGELAKKISNRGQTFFSELVERDPDMAVDVHRSLSENAQSDSMTATAFDLEGLLRGDPELGVEHRVSTLPEDTIPALQLARHDGDGAERLAERIVQWVKPDDLQVRGTNGSTPLSIMAEKGWVTALENALEAGVDPNFGVDGMTVNPVEAAMNNAARPDLGYAAVKKLFEHKLDSRWLEVSHSSAPSIVKFAVDHADVDLLGTALIYGANPNGHPASNYSPMRAAIEQFESDPAEYEKILTKLVMYGASLKRLDADMLSPSARLTQPEMAAARDFVYRLSVSQGLGDQYGYHHAKQAVDWFYSVSDLDGSPESPDVSLGTLQLIPGMSRALVDQLSYEDDIGDVQRSMLRVTPLSDGDIRAMDLVDSSRTLLRIPEVNRERMRLEVAKVRSALTSMGPEQISAGAIDQYQKQIMAANRLQSWLADSIGQPDTPESAAALSASHGRHLERSFIDFADAIKASPLTLNPEVSNFPLRLSVEGSWVADVTVSGDRHEPPKPGEPASFLYGQTHDGTVLPRAVSPSDGGELMTYMASVEGVGVMSQVDTGLVSFDNPTVIYADDPMHNDFTVDASTLKQMGYDGAIIYDMSRGRVAGAMDLGGKRLEFPNGVEVVAESQMASRAPRQAVEREAEPEPSSTPRRGLGM